MKKRTIFALLVIVACQLTATMHASTKSRDQHPTPTALSEQDIEKILLSSTNIDRKRAKLLIKKLALQYGKDKAGNLNISAVLVGYKYKWSHAFFADNDTWKFDASFIPEGSQQVVTVPKLVYAKVSNPGLNIKLFNRECLLVFVPKGTSLAQLNGFKTRRGFMLDLLSLILFSVSEKFFKRTFWRVIASFLIPNPGWLGLTLGFVPSAHGTFYLCSFGIGLSRISIFSFPQLTFRVVPPEQKAI